MFLAAPVLLAVALVTATVTAYEDVVKKAHDCLDPNEGLYFAAHYGTSDLLPLLLENYVGDIADDTIHVALYKGRTEIIKWALDAGQLNASTENLMRVACSGHLDVAKMWFEYHGMDPGNDAIDEAANCGNTEVVEWLMLDYGLELIDPNHALCMAAYNGNTDMVKLLIDSGKADPAADNQCAVRSATIRGYTPVVKLLMEYKGVDTKVAFRLACETGHVEMVKMLIDSDKVNLTDPTDHYVLCWAARNGHDKVVELLLDWGRIDPIIVVKCA